MAQADLIDQISRQAQEYYSQVPVIILGSGASAAFNMSGMWKLAQHLQQKVDVTGMNGVDQALWHEFCELLNNNIDLETALHKVSISPELTKNIVSSTWELLAPEDLQVFYESMFQNNFFPLGRILKHLFKSTQKHIDIITTNYDRLAEYACEQEGIHHYTGFSYGYRRHVVPKDYLQCERQVNIWKVHGSLDWFVAPNGEILCTGNVESVPEHLIPLIVTPGKDKYRNTHREPYKSIIHAADDVLDGASSYLCIGFGFNDEHIQEKLVNRCAKNNASVVVITYQLSESAKKFLLSGNVANWLAIEVGEDNTRSRIYSSKLKDSQTVEGNYWSVSGFTNLIL